MDRAEISHGATPTPINHGSPHSTYLFTGLLRCGRCGASLQIETAKGRSRRYSYYNCREAQSKGACKTRRLPARELDAWLLEIVCGDLFTVQNLRQAVQDLHELAGRWQSERIERRKSVETRMQDMKRRNKKLFEVLEEMGRDAPNLGDIAQRLRENNAQIKKLEEQLIAIDAETAPVIDVADEDIAEIANQLVETLKSSYNPAQARALFADFIEKIVVEDASVRIEYDPRRLVGVIPTAACHVVPSIQNWLPGTGALRTMTRQIPAYALLVGKVAHRG